MDKPAACQSEEQKIEVCEWSEFHSSAFIIIIITAADAMFIYHQCITVSLEKKNRCMAPLKTVKTSEGDRQQKQDNLSIKLTHTHLTGFQYPRLEVEASEGPLGKSMDGNLQNHPAEAPGAQVVSSFIRRQKAIVVLSRVH